MSRHDSPKMFLHPRHMFRVDVHLEETPGFSIKRLHFVGSGKIGGQPDPAAPHRRELFSGVYG